MPALTESNVSFLENSKQSIDIDKQYKKLLQKKRNLNIRLLVFWLIIAGIVVWSWIGTEFKFSYFFSGLGNITQFLVQDLLPPDFSAIPSLIGPALESLYMAYIGAIISVIFSIIFGILAAKNISFHPIIANFSRTLIAFIRALPPIVIGIFFVGAFGIGPLAGTLAIGIGGIGILAKAFADILEEIDEGQIEALKATGASWIQVLRHAVWPQFQAGFVSWSLYKVDLNIRESAILGMIGAGGIGASLVEATALFRYQEAAIAILMIFVLILSVEALTAKVRERILR